MFGMVWSVLVGSIVAAVVVAFWAAISIALKSGSVIGGILTIPYFILHGLAYAVFSAPVVAIQSAIALTLFQRHRMVDIVCAAVLSLTSYYLILNRFGGAMGVESFVLPHLVSCMSGVPFAVWHFGRAPRRVTVANGASSESGGVAPPG